MFVFITLGLQSKNINLSQAQNASRILNQRIDDLDCRSSPTGRSTNVRILTHIHHQHRFDPLGTVKKIANNKNLLTTEDTLSDSSSPCLSKISPTDDALRHDSSNESSVILRKTISDDSDDVTTTDISTPSTTRDSAMSIEKELEALRKDALSDTIDNFTACNRHYVEFQSANPTTAILNKTNNSSTAATTTTTTNNSKNNNKFNTYLIEHHK